MWACRKATTRSPITGNDPEKIAGLAKINAYHMQLFVNFLDTLQSTPDGDGSLLDHALILYGSGMGDPNLHEPKELPIILAGGGTGQLKGGGRHIRYPRWDAAVESPHDAAG